MDASDPRTSHSNTYWWITSLAISVTCCSVLFVWFSNYIYEIKEEIAVAQARSDVVQSRLHDMSADLDMLNQRLAVQQIQIIPANGVQAPASKTAAPAAPTATTPASPPTSAKHPEEPPHGHE